MDINNAFNSANSDMIVANYSTNSLLKYDTKKGTRKYRITGGIPQGSVLGHLLWNIMYDELMKLVLQLNVKLVEHAVDVAMLIIAKYVDEIKLAFVITLESQPVNELNEPAIFPAQNQGSADY